MSDKPIYDPRLDDLFGDDIDMLPDAKPTKESQPKSEGTTMTQSEFLEYIGITNVAVDLDLGIEHAVVKNPVGRGTSHYSNLYHHVVHKSGDGCLFCASPIKCAVYFPPLYELKAHGSSGKEYGSMVALHVCNKCAARLNRRSTLPFKKIVEYVSMLEERGSVRGRTREHDPDSMVVEISKALRNALIHLDGKEIHFDTVTYNPTTKKYFINMLP